MITKILDFLFLNISEKYFIKRLSKIILDNVSRRGMAVVKWKNKKKKDVISIVYTFPKTNKITVSAERFNKLFPNLLNKFKDISEKSKKMC